MRLLRLNGQISRDDILISYPEHIAESQARALIKETIAQCHVHAQMLFAQPRFCKDGFSTTGDYERIVRGELLLQLEKQDFKKFDVAKVPSVGIWNSRPSN